jgi:hypothetical protein
MKKLVLGIVLLSVKSFAVTIDPVSCPLLTDTTKEITLSKTYSDSLSEGEVAYNETLSLLKTPKALVSELNSYNPNPFVKISTLKVTSILSEKKVESGSPCNNFKSVSASIVRECQSNDDERLSSCSTKCVQVVDLGLNIDCR